MSRKYNHADEKQVSKARRAATLEMRRRGFTFRVIGFALGITPARAQQIYHNSLRRHEADTRRAIMLPVPSLETVRRFTSSNNSQPAV